MKGSVAQRALQSIPIHHQLLLACLVLLQSSSGRAEVLEEVLLQRYSDLCRTLGSEKVCANMLPLDMRVPFINILAS